MFKRLLLVLLILTPLVGLAQGSGARIDPFPSFTTISNFPPGNAYPPLLLVPSSKIVLCTYPAVGFPCTNRATTYTDATLNHTCPTSSQVVWNGGTACVSTSDAYGRFGFWVIPGLYTYFITNPRTNQVSGPFAISAGGGSGSGSIVNFIADQSNWPSYLHPAVVNPTGPIVTLNVTSGIIPVGNGGTGTATPGLVNGIGITISGTWPNQTVTCSGCSGSGFPITLGATNISANSTTITIDTLTLSNGTLINEALGIPISGTLTNTVGLPLSTGVVGNLAPSHLNSGSGASSTTFWRGDGIWAAPPSAGLGSGNTMVGTNGSGVFVNMPEKEVATAAGVTTMTCDEDHNQGIYDPRCSRYAGGLYGPTPSDAVQAMSNQMNCDLAMGIVNRAEARFPQGGFALDQIKMAPGSVWTGVPNAQGGTILVSKYNNHNLLDAVISMTTTCSDGNPHTNSLSQTRIRDFTLVGCSTGACVNAPGDSANYLVAGPLNTGLFMQSGAGTFEWLYAQNFGGYGIRNEGQDAKGFHNTLYSNDEWFYFGGYKGVKESLPNPEVSATTTGSTSKVTLNWASVAGATGYVIYRGSSTGGESTYFTSATNSFVDTGAAGTAGIVTNVVTSAALAPGTATATPSGTGGTLAAGTYFYKITSSTADGWHGSMEFAGADNMGDWFEVYGLQDNPTAATFHHLADILGGGGYGIFSHLWPQLGLVGIATPFGFGSGDMYTDIRVDFTRQEGVWNDDLRQRYIGGIIGSSCTASNAVTLNTGQDGITPAGICNQFFNSTDAMNISQFDFNVYAGFGPTFETADLFLAGDSIYHDLRGGSTLFQFLNGFGVVSGVNFEPQYNAWTAITGPTPDMSGLYKVSPNDSSAINYTGFQNLQPAQDFYISANTNVTIKNNSNIKTCTNADIPLSSIHGLLHFITTSENVFGTISTVTQDCSGEAGSTYTLPTASTTVLGGVKVDGTSIVISGGGVISSTTGGSGTVTNIATTGPITGGPITATGTIGCATCIVASSPALGVAHFAGSTQTITSSLVVLTSEVSGILPGANGGTANGFFAVTGPTTSLKTFTFPNSSATILTSANVVTVAQGGIGVGTLTGIAKGNGTSAFTAAASADVVGLWTGTCNSTTFMRADGTCAVPSGSGTVNSGTSTHLAIYATSTNAVSSDATLTDNGTTLTYTGTGGLVSSGPVSTGSSPPTACSPTTGCIALTEASTAGTPTAGQDYLRGDSTTHTIRLSVNGGAEISLGGTGNVSNSGTPTANQMAVWVTSTTIQGVSMGTGVQTWITTPSSANFFSAISDETGSGLVVGNNGPTLIAPVLGTVAAGSILTNATGLPLTTGVTGILPVANGGTGTSTPAIVAGTNVTVSGTWPNQTVNASGGGSSGTFGQSSSVNTAITTTSLVSSAPTTPSMYQINWVISTTVVGVACTGSTSVTLNDIFTDPGAGSATTNPLGTVIIATNGNGTVGYVASGTDTVLAKNATSLSYSTTYTAGTGCTTNPKYQVSYVYTAIH